MHVRFSVIGQPPDRTHPGRCADRLSPNADELVRAARDLLARDPTAFPIREGFGLTVASGARLPAYEGYGVDDAIIEVLVDVGLIADERLERWWSSTVDRALGDSYRVTIEPDHDGPPPEVVSESSGPP
jgi:hypothetical protein